MYKITKMVALVAVTRFGCGFTARGDSRRCDLSRSTEPHEPPMLRVEFYARSHLDRKAPSDLDSARSFDPLRPSFALNQAWAFQATGQSDRARTRLQEAEKLGVKASRLDPLERAVFRRLR